MFTFETFSICSSFKQGGAQSSICPEQKTILEILWWEIFVGTRDEIFVQSGEEIFVGSRNPRSGGLIKAQQKSTAKILFPPKCLETANLTTFWEFPKILLKKGKIISITTRPNILQDNQDLWLSICSLNQPRGTRKLTPSPWVTNCFKFS